MPIGSSESLLTRSVFMTCPIPATRCSSVSRPLQKNPLRIDIIQLLKCQTIVPSNLCDTTSQVYLFGCLTENSSLK